MNTERNEQIARLFQAEASRVERAVAASAKGVSRADIEDACAIAWTILTRREDIDATDPRIVKFLVVVATREAWKLARRQTERPTYDPQDAPEATDDRDALDVVLDREVLALVGQLPERQQTVILLRVEGLSRQDIAQATGWTLRTVDRQLYRALAHLRDLLA